MCIETSFTPLFFLLENSVPRLPETPPLPSLLFMTYHDVLLSSQIFQSLVRWRVDAGALAH